jgi:DNA-binding transcriptional LysR family regulator
MLQLKYFITVVSTGSVSKAAPLLFVSRPAISRALKELEYELGVSLFIRTASGLELTEIGQLLYRNFTKIQQLVDQTDMQIDNYKEMQKDCASGVLKIGLSPVTSVVFFPKFYQAFILAYPNITMTSVEYDYNRNIAALSDGSLDFLLVTDSLINELPVDFQTLDFCENELALAVSSKHILAKKPSVTVEVFKDEPLIYMTTHTDVEQFIDKSLKPHGYTPHVIVRTQQLSAVTEFVSKGLGCSVLTKGSIPDRDSKDIVFIPISPTIKMLVRLIWNTSLPQKEVSHNLVEFSKKYKESLAESI